MPIRQYPSIIANNANEANKAKTTERDAVECLKPGSVAPLAQFFLDKRPRRRPVSSGNQLASQVAAKQS